jgi:hypothetical protein
MKTLLFVGLLALSTLGAAKAEIIYNDQGQEIGHTVSNRSWGNAMQNSATKIEVPLPHHFDSRYFNPTLGSVHQIRFPWAWAGP